MNQENSVVEKGSQYRLIPKKDVLEYKNQGVVESIESRLGKKPEDAEMLFADVLKFLSLLNNSVRLWLSPEIKKGLEIFILHTGDYYDFNLKYFDRFIEYSPERGFSGGQRMDVEQTTRLVWKVYPMLSVNWK